MSNNDTANTVVTPPILQPDKATLPGKKLMPGSHLGFGNEPFNETGYGR